MAEKDREIADLKNSAQFRRCEEQQKRIAEIEEEVDRLRAGCRDDETRCPYYDLKAKAERYEKVLQVIGSKIGSPTMRYLPVIEQKELLERMDEVSKIIQQALENKAQMKGERV